MPTSTYYVSVSYNLLQVAEVCNHARRRPILHDRSDYNRQRLAASALGPADEPQSQQRMSSTEGRANPQQACYSWRDTATQTNEPPCRNYRQGCLLLNWGGEIRTRDLLSSSRVSGETLSRCSLRTTPCRIHALTGADGRWFMRVLGWVTLTSSSQQQRALSLTLTLFGTPERA